MPSHGRDGRRARVREARRVGVAVVLACALTSSLFAAPLIATHLDFAHTHPEDAEPHVHDIQAVLVPSVAAPVTALPDVPVAVAPRRGSGPRVVPCAVADPAHPPRAPPASSRIA